MSEMCDQDISSSAQRNAFTVTESGYNTPLVPLLAQLFLTQLFCSDQFSQIHRNM